MNITPQIEIPRGDSRILPFEVTDANTNEVIFLEGATIDWALYTRSGNKEVLSLDDDGIEIINRDNDAGEFSVKINASATSDLPLALYTEYVVIVDELGDRTTFEGTIFIEESTI